jgi:hypothetical protein
MELDYPKVRAQTVCPLCQGAKETGLLVCWLCYHKHELRYGNPKAETVIAHSEHKATTAPLKAERHTAVKGSQRHSPD